jgi:hypothetical protein
MEKNTIFKLNGKYGIRSLNNEILVPAEYDDFVLLSGFDIQKGDRITAIKDDKYGVLSVNGESTSWILEPIYEFIGVPNNVTYVYKDGEYAVYNFRDKCFIIEHIEELSVHAPGFFCANGIGTFTKKNKKGIITEDGRFTEANFDDIDEGDWHGLVKVKEGDQWGYVNADNNFTQDEDECAYFFEV